MSNDFPKVILDEFYPNGERDPTPVCIRFSNGSQFLSLTRAASLHKQLGEILESADDEPKHKITPIDVHIKQPVEFLTVRIRYDLDAPEDADD